MIPGLDAGHPKRHPVLHREPPPQLLRYVRTPTLLLHAYDTPDNQRHPSDTPVTPQRHPYDTTPMAPPLWHPYDRCDYKGYAAALESGNFTAYEAATVGRCRLTLSNLC